MIRDYQRHKEHTHCKYCGKIIKIPIFKKEEKYYILDICEECFNIYLTK